MIVLRRRRTSKAGSSPNLALPICCGLAGSVTQPAGALLVTGPTSQESVRIAAEAWRWSSMVDPYGGNPTGP